jgi:tRNA A-37 threonylcarbamoyl transferase component Bud32
MAAFCPFCHHPNRDTAHFCAACATPIVLAGRFRVQRKVGQGGMGCVYQAEDLRLVGKVWAVKEMSDTGITDPVEKQRAIAGFKRESQILATLNHPNIPRVIDSFQQGSKHYIVTEFVDGSTLHDLLQARGRPFPEAEVRPWLVQLLSALACLHACLPPIIFRDLKPQNIMVDRSGQIKLIDFGIARSFQPGKAKDTTLLGTPGYAAPEQHGQSQTDVRSDIYALGVTLHQLLTGHDPMRTPYNLPSLRPLVPGLSPAMEQIVTRATALRPQDRWQSVSEIQAALNGSSLNSAQPQGGNVRMPTVAPSMQTLQMPYQAPATRLPNRPTTKLLMAVATLSNRQLAVVLSGLVLLVVLGVWVLAPIIQRDIPVIFNNVPLFMIAGPMAYAAIRRRWVAFAAQVTVTLAGWLTWWLRTGLMPGSYASFLLATIACGLVVEAGMYFLPRVRGAGGGDAWQREIGWFAVVTAFAAFVFYNLMPGELILMRLGLWIGASLVGALGWFLGDLIQQWLYLRKAGIRRLTRP